LSIRVQVKGLKAFEAAAGQLTAEMRKGVDDAVAAGGLMMQSEIKKRIQRGPATGRIYKRRGVVHQASAPGESPMSDTGRLANSVMFDRKGYARASVFSGLMYAAYLEWGTSRMSPRPVWMPVAKQYGPKIRSLIEAALGSAIK
jgi:HK97 gp10 family phage protein